MKRFDNREEAQEYLSELDNDELVELWNEYTEAENRFDDRIYQNYECEFEAMFGNLSAWEVARLVEGNSWNYAHDYFKIDGYGYPVSFSNPLEHIDEGELIDYLTN